MDEIDLLRNRKEMPARLATGMHVVILEGLGDFDRATALLEQRDGDPSCASRQRLRLYLVDPRFERLAAYPRFQALVRRVGFAP